MVVLRNLLININFLNVIRYQNFFHVGNSLIAYIILIVQNEMCASQKASGTELATASSRDVPQRITKQPPNSILAERMQKYTSSSEQLLR